MPDSTIYLSALTILQNEIQAALTVEQLATVARSFFEQMPVVEGVGITPTAVAAPTGQLAFPIAHTGYQMTVTAVVQDDATSLLTLVTAVLATAPCFLETQPQTETDMDMVRRIMRPVRHLMPPGQTVHSVHEQLVKLFPTTMSFVALVEAQTSTIEFPSVMENGKRVQLDPISARDQKHLVTWVIEHGMSFMTGSWPDEAMPVSLIPGRSDTTSLLCVPLRAEREIIGAICLQHAIPQMYSNARLHTLRLVADDLAVAVQNARLYATTQSLVDKGTRDYQTAVALRQAIAMISTSLDEHVVVARMLLALGNIVTYNNAFVFLRDHNTMKFAASRDFYDRPIRLTPEQIDAVWQHAPLLQELELSRDIIRLSDVREDGRWIPYAEGQKIRSWMGVSLSSGGELIGILIFDSHDVNAFDERAEWLASTLASHAAVAIQNAGLYHQTQQQLLELSTLYQASATMTANLDQDSVLQTVVAEMVRALQVDTCTIFVWDKNQQTLTPAAHKNQTDFLETDPDSHSLTAGLSHIANLADNPVVRYVLNTQQLESLRIDDAESVGVKSLLADAKLQALMLVPLVRRGNLFGLLGLGQIDQQRPYTQGELRLAQNLAGQAAVALEHAHLYSQAQRRIDELATFHDIVLQLNSPLKLNTVLDVITESAMKLIDATNLHIFLYDQATQGFTAGSALWRDGRRHTAVAKLRSSGQGLTATVVKQGQPIVINDAASHPFYQSPEAKAWGIYAIAGFPLKYDQQIIGVFTVTYLHPHTFSDEELLVLNLLAEQAAVAVHNAALYSESERRLRDMQALVELAKQVTGDLHLESVLQTTVQNLRRLLNARASTITMLSEDGEELIVKAADGVDPEFMNARMKLEDSISGKVLKESRLIYTRDSLTDPEFLFFDLVVRSLLVVPLIVRDSAIGTLTVDSAHPNAFAESDIQLMTIAAAQVSVAISNARLFEEVEDRAEELAVAYEELKESDRLKDELVQNVSHELRTPLTFVKGYVDLLMDGDRGLLTPEQQEYLQIVADKTDDITRIIEDIITLQRIDSGNLQLERLSMRDVLQTTVNNHSLVADKKGLTVELAPTTTRGWVHIDRQRINQVLDNLIGNAMKFSPDGGTIKVLLLEQDDDICVIVKDEGIGMPADKHQRIFERFYQIDGSSRRRFGGTGIGLAIVKRIIDAHQGKIWVESEINQGSSFYFTLPKAKADVGEFAPF
jgi:GAF domain-containing protein